MLGLRNGDCAKYDSSDLLSRILKFPEQLQHAQTLSKSVEIAFEADRILNICVTGMGGSAMSGDIVRTYLSDVLKIPIFVNRYYSLPNFVDEHSLVIVTSYSGDTEETLEAYDVAGARHAKIICVTSGGLLGEKAKFDRHPIYLIPTGYPPRSALGYLTVPILYSLHSMALTPNPEADILESVTLLERLAEQYHPNSEDNLAKEISYKLKDKIPLIYASVSRFEAVAFRWKTQLSENSKVLAFYNSFPELNHNEIMGWGPLREINRNFQVICLKDRDDHPKVKQRMSVTKEILEKKTAPIIEVESQGNSLLARILSLVFLGDMVSFYLAILNQVDPTPVKNIDYLKQRLREYED
ncbi:MAG: bifunctional phosphoglucose/phosphomannose isomerase [bacterium]